MTLAPLRLPFPPALHLALRSPPVPFDHVAKLSERGEVDAQVIQLLFGEDIGSVLRELFGLDDRNQVRVIRLRIRGARQALRRHGCPRIPVALPTAAIDKRIRIVRQWRTMPMAH